MKFKQFVDQLQTIEAESSRNVMTQQLANIFTQSSDDEIQAITYFVLGSMSAPYLDKQFNLAEKGIIHIIALLLDQTDQQVEKSFKVKGDLGLVVYDQWENKDDGLSVLEVYAKMQHVLAITGNGSVEKKTHAIVDLLRQFDAVGAKYVIRIMSKTLRLGFSDMTVLDALSWMAVSSKKLSKELEHAYNICADLGLVAKTFKTDGLVGIQKMQIHVGIPIRPAAAERLKNPQAIIDKLGTCVAQPKLDGFRVQVHLKKTKNQVSVEFFSRNLLDMSSMFPELGDAVASLPFESLICEGEAIVYDADTQTFLPFQQTVKRKRKHDIEQISKDFPLRLYLFDILYLNNQSLLNLTHQERRQQLLYVVKQHHGDVIHAIEEEKIETAAQLESYFLKNITQGLEGLVVKRPDTIYQPGKRNFNWIKLKRESHATLIDTIDVVILGYYVGQGKRAKFGIGAFLVGIYHTSKDQFETVAKVGTGMSDDEWKELKKRCDRLSVGHQPKNVVCAKELAVDVWVEPEIVCTVKSDEITWSPLHTAAKNNHNLGLALRFPRFIQYRMDKNQYDATTDVELKHLFEQQKKVGVEKLDNQEGVK